MIDKFMPYTNTTDGITIDGRTKICGLIGMPVEHTLSPLIHNTLSLELNRNMAYIPLPVLKEGLQDAILGAYALGFAGMNVTVPYKSSVIAYLKETDPLAAKVGAVNTLVRIAGGYKGFNTDLPGLCRAMADEGISFGGADIILLGAGGASRAAAFLCAGQGAHKVYLLNRDLQKAVRLACEVNTYSGRDCIEPMLLSDYKTLPVQKYLAIQATSVGLYPHVEEAVIMDPAFYDLIHTGYDLVYRPFETKFMKLVKQAGGKAFNGLKMLLYQGIEAYELWNNITVEEACAAKLYQRIRKELNHEA